MSKMAEEEKNSSATPTDPKDVDITGPCVPISFGHSREIGNRNYQEDGYLEVPRVMEHLDFRALAEKGKMDSIGVSNAADVSIVSFVRRRRAHVCRSRE